MSLFQRKPDGSLQIEHLPPHSNVVTDVTGAGDTAVAVFTLALGSKRRFLQCCGIVEPRWWDRRWKDGVCDYHTEGTAERN